MMAEPREIDRLIEEGLLLYGQGELDSALMIWEKALSIDPDNPQANSYVDYVRMNYELLTNDTASDEAGGFGSGFGLDDEEPYRVEVGPGEIATAGAPAYADPADEGWFIEGELSTRGAAASAEEPGPEPPARTMTMEADEPPDAPAAQHESEKPVSFDDETREYEKGRPPPKLITEPGIGVPERTPAPAEFDGPELTPGFQAQLTDIRKRDLGFVQPRAELPLPAPPPDGSAMPVDLELPQRPHRKTSPPPELKMTLRTPSKPDTAGPPDPVADFDTGAGQQKQSTTNAPTAELDPREPGPRIAAELAASTLVSTLPTPLRNSRAITPIAMPPPPPIAISKAPTTRMMSGEISIADLQIEPGAPTRELSPSSLPAFPGMNDPFVSAPTRELGMRPFIPMRSPAPGDDEPTRDHPIPQVAIVIPEPGPGDGTRHDMVLPFDPIDARSAQILQDIDTAAPASEGKEDRTRRRITSLLERAVEWVRSGESDKAVAAVDLALSEDPNAALAQKLLHRNRDTIMSVFQGYIGDLQRVPVLAKPLNELAKSPISPRAAFLLSRVDGSLTLDEILDVSGMPRLEAYRYLCQLLLRGILR